MTSVRSTPQRDHEVRVHRALVPVDHEVRVEPEVERAVAPAHRAGRASAPCGDDRARLQAVALAVLDRVAAVVEDAVQALVQVRHVVAAVEVVVDEDLPVAVERVAAALDRSAAPPGPAGAICATRSAPRNSCSDGPPGSSAHEHPFLPRRRSPRGTRPLARAVEVAHAGEARCPLERAVERVGPAVVRAAQRGWPCASVTTAAAWCRQTLKKARSRAANTTGTWRIAWSGSGCRPRRW